MAEFKIKGPDGAEYNVNAPDGASEEQVLNYFKTQVAPSASASPPVSQKKEPLPAAMGQEGMNWAERGAAGVLDPMYGGRQAFYHLLGTKEQIAQADNEIREREAFLTKGGAPEGDLGRSVGRAVPALVAGALVPGGGILGAMAGGAAAESLNPVTSKDYAEEKAKQALIGAAFGTAGGAVAKTFSKVAPTGTDASKQILAQGVDVTPGQFAGGALRRMEEAFKSTPILGQFIRNAENRSIESFNRAAINQALSPIGATLPRGVAAGREAVSEAADTIGGAYDNILPRMNLDIDAQLASDVANARNMARFLPKDQARQFNAIIDERFNKPFTQHGTLDGDKLKELESTLSYFSRNYSSSNDPAHRQLGHLVEDVRSSTRDALLRQNPTEAPELKKINEAFAMFVRVQNASTRRAGSDGVFSPLDLLTAIRSGDSSVRRGHFAAGDALMQEFAEAAQKVLPAKMADSGTPERAMFNIAGGVGIGSLLSPTVIAGAATVPLVYSKPGIAAFGKYAQPGPTREAASRLLRSGTPEIGSALEPIMYGTTLDALTSGSRDR